jgi:hypothetical protein
VTRLDIGHGFERVVAGELRSRGWAVEPFGIELLTPSAKGWLIATGSPARWLPDLIAKRARDVVVIDAKSSLRHDRHSVETRSALAAVGFEQWTGIRELFVFPDGCVARPETVIDRGEPGRLTAFGSGKPYHLIACTACLAGAAVFGPKTLERS